MEDSNLRAQIISFCVTLALLAVSTFVFRDVSLIDYLLMAVSAAELTGIVITLVKAHKK